MPADNTSHQEWPQWKEPNVLYFRYSDLNRCLVIPQCQDLTSRTVQRYNDQMRDEIIMTVFSNNLLDFLRRYRVATCSTGLVALRSKH
jgi:hypothetical protein